MRWQLGRRSDNIEDERSSRPVGRGIKLGGGAILLVAVVALITGKDPRQLVSLLEEAGGTMTVDQGAPQAPGQASDPQADFVSVVLADTEDTWGALFTAAGRRYEPPKLVLFNGDVDSACGFTSAAVGPFYCPGDAKVYLDLSFFRELDAGFGAPGDFARAYVVAHEIGHHVQNLLGVTEQVDRMSARAGEEQRNAISVRQELEADCFAGVWANHASKDRQILEAGDVEEGLGAAAAIGDDRLQRQSGGTVQPESWTHGSSAMRVRWFKRGLESGRVDACDTFKASQL